MRDRERPVKPQAPWKNKLLRVFSVLALVMAVSLPGVAESTSHLRQVKGSADAPLRIKGAKVSTEDQAEKLASEAYFKRMGGKRAIQTAKVVSILKLDVAGVGCTDLRSQGSHCGDLGAFRNSRNEVSRAMRLQST